MSNAPTTFADFSREFDRHSDEGDHTCQCGEEYGTYEDHFDEVIADAWRIATDYRDALIERLLLGGAVR